MRPLFVSIVMSLTVGLAGCADGSGMACRVGADCASGVCNSDGTCGRSRPDSGAPDAATTVTPDAFTPIASDAGPTPDTGVRVCTPNGDGTITREESPLRAGLYATFRIAEGATVDTVGTNVSGERRWDLSGSFTGDHDERVELLAPAGAWWSGDYPLATYAARLSGSSDNLGVFQITDTALLLLGVVSPEDGVTRTNLENDPPVEVLRFPLAEGATWSTRTTVSGVAVGVIAAYTEEYTFVADGHGVMATPFGDVDVLRVRSELERTSGFATLDTRRTFAFVGECFGTVATITSESFETDSEFTRASEVRRLAP
ncbi:MAG: hypothetical protein J0L92_05390 [Deltaproteobacteria bacterium]|nr:hypothetical protein [Deltaproteobacteria bacterium]